MNTMAHFPLTRRPLLLLAGLGLLGTGLTTALAAKDPVYENYVDFSVGLSEQTGNTPRFQKAQTRDADGFAGVEDMLYSTEVGKGTTFTLRGHALAGNNDYLLDMSFVREEVGYIKLGYKEFRVWYDGMGGYYPPNGLNLKLFDEDLHIDRSNLWFEAGYIPPGKVNFVFRYDLFTREGTKDSTSWGDTALAINAANTRGLLPSFYKIDEKRHQVSATVSQQRTKDNWAFGLRYDQGDYTNSRNETRRARETGQDRKITHKEGRDYDLFMIRGSYVNQIHEKLMLTTAVARTKIDTTISGTRIYGPDYDPVYDATFVNRQARDEGFFNLTGETEMTQTIGTLSALYQPNAKWSIVPSLRFEQISTDSIAEFVETNFTTARLPDNTDLESTSERSWKNAGESIEFRYRGLKNATLNFKAELVQATGELSEQEIDEPGTPAEHVTIDRDTDFERSSQKYSATANWYPKAGTTVAVQYYFKGRQNDYRSSRDSTVSTADRYPAYIANQDFETNDFNVRLSLRATPKVRLVTRYDYQKSTIRTQDIGLAFGESASMTSHIISETISLNPLDRWYVQGTVNYVWDQLTTPAVSLTGAAGNRVKNSDANYLNFTLSTGYALDEGSDIYADYSLYSAFDDFIDNSAGSVAYGTNARTQQVGVTWFRRLNYRTSLTVRYAFVDHQDDAVGTLADYDAHMIYTKLQYRF